MWKTRTRNKILVFVLLYLGAAVGYVLYGWAEKGRTGADLIITALLGSGALMAIINFLVIGWENVRKKGE
jgi:hypothetical protein